MATVLSTENELEEVVLLDADLQPNGCMSKDIVHDGDTPLHLAFSLFLFDGKGRFLVQRRALSKKTWPGVWSNSCCGHPAPGESIKDAVYRRVQYELGVTLTDIECVLPHFRYRACWKGIWENELCPVWIGFLDETPGAFEPSEIEAVEWVSWKEFSSAAHTRDGGRFSDFSPWSLMEARQLERSEQFHRRLSLWQDAAGNTFDKDGGKSHAV